MLIVHTGDSATRKSVCMSIVLLLLTQLCGVPVILNYMTQMFVEAGISFDPNYASCIVAALQFFGSYLAIVLVERLGRKASVIYIIQI